MAFNLKDKNILITGSTYGIGLAIAQKFQKYGSNVAINSRKKKSLDTAEKLFNKPVQCILGDMTSEEEAKECISQFIKKFKKIDILVCNVGTGRSATPLNESISDWEKSISLNLFSAINPISASLKYLSKTSGVITCISSICGGNMVENAPLTYSSAKAALDRFIKSSSYS